MSNRTRGTSVTSARPEVEPRPSDLARLKHNGRASVEELREFLGQLEARSPQEVLGAVAESGLVRSIAVAAVGCGLLLILLTVLPYWMSADSSSAESATVKSAATAEESPAAEAPAPNRAKETPAASASAPASGVQDAANRMGIGQAKTSPPETNPLDRELDGLLDGID